MFKDTKLMESFHKVLMMNDTLQSLDLGGKSEFQTFFKHYF